MPYLIHVIAMTRKARSADQFVDRHFSLSMAGPDVPLRNDMHKEFHRLYDGVYEAARVHCECVNACDGPKYADWIIIGRCSTPLSQNSSVSFQKPS
jgi:hypothetical protein